MLNKTGEVFILHHDLSKSVSRHIVNSLRLFLGEYTLVFVILMVIYSKYFFIFYIRVYSLSIPLLLIPYIVLSVLLIISNYGYYHLITTEKDKESPKTYHVTEIEDLSAIYANIIMTYVLALLSIFPATFIGLIAFIIVLFFIFELFKDSEILFFNPILSLMNCRIYKIRVEEHNKSIYIIYKEKIQEGDYIRVRHLYENIYLDERIIEKYPEDYQKVSHHFFRD